MSPVLSLTANRISAMHSNLVRNIWLALLLACANAHASEDWHTWGAIVATGDLGGADSKLRYWLEGQGRFNDDSSRFNQGILRGALGLDVAPRATVWAGYAFIPTDPQNRRDDIVEHRAWQQLTWSAAQPLAGFAGDAHAPGTTDDRGRRRHGLALPAICETNPAARCGRSGVLVVMG